MVFQEINEYVGIESDALAFEGEHLCGARYHDRRSRLR